MPLLMKFPGITGEGTVEEHIGWFALTGFDWGGTRAVRRVLKSSGQPVVTIAPPQMRSATVRRKSDSQSALFWMLMVGRAADVPKVTLEWLRTGQGSPVCYFSIEFDGVRIARISEDSTGDHPIESMDLLYRTVTLGVRDVGNSLTGAQDIVTYSVPLNM
ncbi:type VI secretion system tube protein Hcp [Roseomonas sp. CAU 1739]|uniref:type VI secretion system tube protein Hcp n=1 Tax=Roseomonas sp. CAU 1739 TaxID=3140364 RepID=UPI00325B90F1